MNKFWTEISVETSAGAADVVTQLLVGIGCAGAIVETVAEGVVVKGYLRESAGGAACVDALRERLQTAVEWGVAPPGFRIECQRIPEEDWAEGWKARFQPLEIGERLLIQPTWVELPSDCRRCVVWLDPGMAFGTGQHATTQGCLEFLERIIRGGETVLDIGTGSGILAIAAAKLGAGRVVALDIDPLCLEVARENVARNQASDRVFLLRGSCADALRVRADVVVANLSTADILDMLPQVPRVLKSQTALIPDPSPTLRERGEVAVAPLSRSVGEGSGVRAERLQSSGTFIASGIPSSRRWEVEVGLQQTGFIVQGITEREGWVTFAAHLHKVNGSMGQ